ncbi:uncharacterized protein LOC117783852 [Drosophila innubila]|uniref:uncharacterized protein LOC117783852 n=1 Tax=Drosophila innubila TaxID=198719 RepID=UPI00148B9F62|nr:uncharacterized protein LOC117783852 [Drosophila innubila]
MDEETDNETEVELISLLDKLNEEKEEYSIEEYFKLKKERWEIDLQVEKEKRLDREESEKMVAINYKEEKYMQAIVAYLNQMLLRERIDAQDNGYPRTKWLQKLNDDMDVLKEERREKVIGLKLMCPITEMKSRSETEFFNKPVNLRELISLKFPQQQLEDLILPPEFPWDPQMMSTRIHYTKALFQMFRENIRPTVGVVTDSKQLYCHSMLLALISEYFHQLPSCPLIYLPPCIISSEDFVRVYRWMLEPLTNLTLRQMMELTRAAHYLKIKELHSQCWKLIFDSLKSIDKIFAVYTVAKKVCVFFEKQLSPYLIRIWLPFAGSSEFVNLDYDKIYSLFKMDMIAVNTEIEILYSLFLWLDYDWESRKCHTLDLIKLVHFDMMPYLFLITFDRRTDGPPALKFLSQSLAIQKLIRENIDKLKRKPDRYKGAINNHRRHWIYDSGCKYHHSQACNRLRFVSYDDFIEYIEFLQASGHPCGHRIKLSSDSDIACCKPRNASK